MGYIWVTFLNVNNYDLIIGDIRGIAVAQQFRGQGIGSYILDYIEKSARLSGAKLLRSGTGFDNLISKSLHENRGFKEYRIEFEKILD